MVTGTTGTPMSKDPSDHRGTTMHPAAGLWVEHTGRTQRVSPTSHPSFCLPLFREGQGVVFIVLGKKMFVKLFIVAYTSLKEIPGHLLLLTMETG